MQRKWRIKTEYAIYGYDCSLRHDAKFDFLVLDATVISTNNPAKFHTFGKSIQTKTIIRIICSISPFSSNILYRLPPYYWYIHRALQLTVQAVVSSNPAHGEVYSYYISILLVEETGEKPEKTTDLSQVIDKLYHIM
jgi:hypothetical protein